MLVQRIARRWRAAISEREIHVAIKIQNLDSISTVQHSFHADFTIVLNWSMLEKRFLGIVAMEKMAKTKGPLASGLIDYWNATQTFLPKVDFDNAKEINQVEADTEMRKLPRTDADNEGTVKWTMRFIGTFRTTFDLGMFPFDSQTLDIKLRFRRQGQIKKVRALASVYRDSKLVSEAVEKSDMIVLPDIELMDGQLGESTRFTVRMFVQRAWRRYFWNILCINFALAAMGWCVLVFVPLSQMSQRLDAILNLLLTSVAFKFAVNDDLPKLPFLTALDKYVLINFAFLFIHAVESWWVGSLAIAPKNGRSLIFGHAIFNVDITFDQDDAAALDVWVTKAQDVEIAFIYIIGTFWVLLQAYVVRFAAIGIRKMRLQYVYSKEAAESIQVRAAEHVDQFKTRRASLVLAAAANRKASNESASPTNEEEPQHVTPPTRRKTTRQTFRKGSVEADGFPSSSGGFRRRLTEGVRRRLSSINGPAALEAARQLQMQHAGIPEPNTARRGSVGRRGSLSLKDQRQRRESKAAMQVWRDKEYDYDAHTYHADKFAQDDSPRMGRQDSAGFFVLKPSRSSKIGPDADAAEALALARPKARSPSKKTPPSGKKKKVSLSPLPPKRPVQPVNPAVHLGPPTTMVPLAAVRQREALEVDAGAGAGAGAGPGAGPGPETEEDGEGG